MSEIKKHSSELLDAIHLFNIEYKELHFLESDIVLADIIRKYTTENAYYYPLWDRFVDYESIQIEYAWEKFDFLKDKQIVFFFDQLDDRRMFSFDGKYLAQVLDNCYRFTFYLTNQENTFVIAYNDHDFLIGVGDAKNWVKDL